MAVDERSFGGWLVSWRELKEHGIDPHEDFTDLSFGGTHDAVVYAVQNGKVDAGAVRTDVLERMEAEGKINLKDFYLFSHDHAYEYPCEFPFFHSTILYPEWPFARVKHTSNILAEKVAAALLEMSPESSAAKAAICAGWTICRCMPDYPVYSSYGTA
jgi:ABC-type phosphate/phosphonate transport system substrate-binding protein